MVSSDEEVEANHAAAKEEAPAKEEQWEDPICRLFQDQAKDVTEAGCSSSKREISPVTPPTSPSPPASAPPAPETRQASFLEMGFPFDLVERAFRQHGERFYGSGVRGHYLREREA
jgi:hypothetical protein